MAITLRAAANGDNGTGPSATCTCAIPTGTTVDDLLLLFIDGTGAPVGTAITAPSGWSTREASVFQGTNISQTVFYKIADGSEGSSLTLSGMPSAGHWEMQILGYTGIDLTTPFDAADVLVSSGSTYPTLGGIVTATRGAWVIGHSGIRTISGVTSTTWTGSNQTQDTAGSSTATSATNSAAVTGHQLVSSPGGLTPGWTPSGSPSKGLGVTLALRPLVSSNAFFF